MGASAAVAVVERKEQLLVAATAVEPLSADVQAYHGQWSLLCVYVSGSAAVDVSAAAAVVVVGQAPFRCWGHYRAAVVVG